MLFRSVKVDPQYGMTTVGLNNLAYDTDPFVLADDVAQVFYVKDMSTKSKKKKICSAPTLGLYISAE